MSHKVAKKLRNIAARIAEAEESEEMKEKVIATLPDISRLLHVAAEYIDSLEDLVDLHVKEAKELTFDE